MVENCTHYSPLNTKGQWEFGVEVDKYKVGQSLIPSLTTMDFIDIFFDEYEELSNMKSAQVLKHIKTWEDYQKYRKDIIVALKLSSNKVQKKPEVIHSVNDWI